MIVITTILFLSVIIPFVSTKKVKELSIDIAWGLLFFVWAFQYEMSKDWSVYVSRWKIANYNLNLQTFDLEPIYEFILKICNPFSYYGYLILSALRSWEKQQLSFSTVLCQRSEAGQGSISGRSPRFLQVPCVCIW